MNELLEMEVLVIYICGSRVWISRVLGKMEWGQILDGLACAQEVTGCKTIIIMVAANNE